MWNNLKSWMAVSPIASGLRTAVALGAVSALNFVLDNYAGWGLPLVAQLALAAVIPPALRALNPADGVFGAGVQADAADAAEEEAAA